jgi:hypothetical protein
MKTSRQCMVLADHLKAMDNDRGLATMHTDAQLLLLMAQGKQHAAHLATAVVHGRLILRSEVSNVCLRVAGLLMTMPRTVLHVNTAFCSIACPWPC